MLTKGVVKVSKYPLRTRIAIAAAQSAGKLSRALGRGAGGMIGGRVATSVDPGILSQVAEGRRIVLVTGTNGKSTTNAMVRAALNATGQAVASNVRGDNMVPGNLVALLDNLVAPWAALEVDELHLGAVAEAVKPEVFVLLNLSRDQLDRVGEITRVEKHLRETINRHPDAWVVANCDDPLICSAAWDAPKVVWVSAGTSWTEDAMAFPRGGGCISYHEDGWEVPSSPHYRRPQPQWELEGNTLLRHGPTESDHWQLELALPGAVNRGNAAQAVAAATVLGIDPAAAVAAVNEVRQVAGRYSRVEVDGRSLHLLLAKNPAGWREALAMLDPGAKTIILATNGQIPDGEDLSWLWDVDFEVLAHSQAPIIVTGERGADLAVRLLYAGVDAQLKASMVEAIRIASPGPVEVLANYTAFRDLKSWLQREGYGTDE